MAVRRTLKQKRQAEERRTTITYHFDGKQSEVEAPLQSRSATPSPETKVPQLFGFPVHLIYGDLIRTLIVTTIIISLLVAVALSGKFS